MKLVSVNQTNINLLRNFIENLGKASKSFRYYNHRSLDVIDKHLITLLLLENNEPVAYGHLELENEIVWLGVCVLSAFQNKGYGKLIVAKLINTATDLHISQISLTVDKTNIKAINLYEKFNFKKESDFHSYSKFSLFL